MRTLAVIKCIHCGATALSDKYKDVTNDWECWLDRTGLICPTCKKRFTVNDSALSVWIPDNKPL